jgi:hypothetical protein
MSWSGSEERGDKKCILNCGEETPWVSCSRALLRTIGGGGGSGGNWFKVIFVLAMLNFQARLPAIWLSNTLIFAKRRQGMVTCLANNKIWHDLRHLNSCFAKRYQVFHLHRCWYYRARSAVRFFLRDVIQRVQLSDYPCVLAHTHNTNCRLPQRHWRTGFL